MRMLKSVLTLSVALGLAAPAFAKAPQGSHQGTLVAKKKKKDKAPEGGEAGGEKKDEGKAPEGGAGGAGGEEKKPEAAPN